MYSRVLILIEQRCRTDSGNGRGEPCLRDAALCETLVARAQTYRRWRQMCRDGISRRALQDFYARHKYLVMSRHLPTYRQLGRLLGQPGARPLVELAEQVIALILYALRQPVTRGGQINAL